MCEEANLVNRYLTERWSDREWWPPHLTEFLDSFARLRLLYPQCFGWCVAGAYWRRPVDAGRGGVMQVVGLNTLNRLNAMSRNTIWYDPTASHAHKLGCHDMIRVALMTWYKPAMPLCHSSPAPFPSFLFFSFRSYVLSLGFVFSLPVLGANCSMRIYNMVSASGATCDPHVVGRFTCTESDEREAQKSMRGFS